MDQFDEYAELFELIGLSPEAAKVAACGRNYRSEAAARAGYAAEQARAEADHLTELPRPASALAQVSDTLAEAHRVLDAVKGGGSPVTAAPGTPDGADTSPIGVAQQLVESAARSRLFMSQPEAHVLATRVRDREQRRGGDAHAVEYLRTFADSLRTTEVRGVARW